MQFYFSYIHSFTSLLWGVNSVKISACFYVNIRIMFNVILTSAESGSESEGESSEESEKTSSDSGKSSSGSEESSTESESDQNKKKTIKKAPQKRHKQQTVADRYREIPPVCQTLKASFFFSGNLLRPDVTCFILSRFAS